MLRILAATAAALLLAPSGDAPTGAFSTAATPIGETIRWIGKPDELMRGSMVSLAPDGRSRLAIDYRETGDESKRSFVAKTRFRLSGHAGTAAYEAAPGYVGDVLWSPDSKRVALTLSGAGLGGVYDLVLLDKSGGNVISDAFRRRLDPPKRCDLRAHSNVGAVKWLSATQILVAARQPHLDSCPERNRMLLYVYDLAGARILAELTPEQAGRRYPGALGRLLR